MKEEEETEYEKMEKWFTQLEYILNPNFLVAFKKQLYACYEENKKDAYKAANISDEALKIEGILNNVRKSISQHNNKSAENFLYKCFYKDLIKLIKK